MTGALPVVLRLRSELDRLEAIARRAAAQFTGESGMEWAVGGEGEYVRPADPVDNSSVAQGAYGWLGEEIGAHIAFHDPAHVLRTIQAHRKIIDAFETSRTPTAGNVSDAAEAIGVFAGLLIAVRAVASIYFPESDATT